MKDVWPAIIVRAFVRGPGTISNYINPWIVDIGASLFSTGADPTS